MAITINGTTGIAGVDGSASTPSIQGADTNTGMFFPAADTIAFAEGGVEAMRIDSSGNVGIGTTSPSYALDVQSAITTGVGTTIGSYNTASSGSSISTLRMRSAGTGASYWDINTGNTASGLNGSIRFFDNIASAERMRIDSSGNLLFNSGYGSAATAYGCRAWVNFNGTGTPAIRASGNVSSITDHGVGDYTLNFTSSMPDANYSVGGYCMAGSGGGSAYVVLGNDQSPATGSCRVGVGDISTGARDVAFVMFQIFR